MIKFVAGVASRSITESSWFCDVLCISVWYILKGFVSFRVFC